MAQNREHLEKLLQFLDSLVKEPGNEWFVEELSKLIIREDHYQHLPKSKIDDIYELCVEKILRKQAEEFYKDFPIKSIIPTLVEDFVRMESFKRKDDFLDFCLALYQQIECITNNLCESKVLADITKKMWNIPAFLKTEKGKECTIDNRYEPGKTIAQFIFYGKDKSGNPKYIEKSQKELKEQNATDKIRIIVYYLGFKCMMKNTDWDSYSEITSLLRDIYQCRNMNHRGNSQSEWEIENQNRIISLKSFYYFKFHGALTQYIEFVKSGLEILNEITTYSDSIKQ